MRSKFALLLVAAVVFLSMLGRRDLVTSHEGRVAQTARQMAVAGWPWDAQRVVVPVVKMQDIGGGVMRLAPAKGEGDFEVNPWLVPVLNGEVRLQKPPLPYWCAAICFKLFGVSEWAARLVPALLGMISTLLVFDLARSVYGRRIALYSALAWISTFFIVDEFRKAMPDPYLAFCVLLAAWAWIALNRERPIARIVLLSIAVGLGFLAKGPVTILWVAIVVGATRRVKIIPLLVAMVIGIVIGGWWYLYVNMHVPHALELWRYESVGELTENMENVRAWWFYGPNLLLIAMPWVIVAAVGIVDAIRRGRRRIFAVIWLGVAVLFFSLVHQKKNAYLLPAAPAFAMLIGQGTNAIVAGVRRRIAAAGIVATIQAGIGIGFGIALVVLLHDIEAILVMVLSVVPMILILRHRPIKSAVWQPIAYALLIVVFANFYVTDKENQRSSREFMQETQRIIAQNGGQLNSATLAEDASFYLPLDFKGGEGNHVYLVFDDRRDAVKPDVNRMAKYGAGKKVVDAKVILTSGKRWKLVELTVE